MSQGKLAYEQGTNRAADLGRVRCALEKVSRRYPEHVSDLLQMTGAHARSRTRAPMCRSIGSDLLCAFRPLQPPLVARVWMHEISG